MPIRTDLHTQELIAQFRAQRQAAQKPPNSDSSRPASAPDATADSVSIHSNVKLEATVRASGSGSADQVDISLTGNMTVQTANGILEDSVVERISRAFQDAGVDLTIDDGESNTPEATAGRIVNFATSFLDAFKENHAAEAPKAQIQGFMSLIRDAITEGFQNARGFLDGIAKLSETVDENISKTFEVTNTLLDEFHQAQVDGMAATAAVDAAEPEEASDSTTSSQAADGADVAAAEGSEDGSTQLTEGLV